LKSAVKRTVKANLEKLAKGRFYLALTACVAAASTHRENWLFSTCVRMRHRVSGYEK
jgi:hypothetical protein